MSFFKFPLACFVFAASALVSQGGLAEDKVAVPGGSIMFAATAEGGDPTCAFSLVSGDHLLDLTEPNQCRNDRMNYFRLENAPSATYITFYARKIVSEFTRKCWDTTEDTKRGWVYKIKTYIQSVTTGWIQFTTLNGTVPEDDENSGIVQRGVILVSKFYGTGDHKDELSCVRVERSALP
ncbi:hypothetical protein D3C71_1109970 [compost metagenome]